MVFSPPRAGVTDISGATRHDWPDLLSQHGYGCETSLLTLLRSLPMSSPLSLLLLLPPLPRPPCNFKSLKARYLRQMRDDNTACEASNVVVTTLPNPLCLKS